MTEENEQLIKELVKSESDRADLRSQLHAVDDVLARQDALEGASNRIDKIILAINEAAKANSLRGQLEHKEAAYQTSFKSYNDILKAEHALSDSYLRLRKLIGDMHRAPHGSEGVDAMYVFTETELAEQLAERDRLKRILGDNKSIEAALLTMQAQRDEALEAINLERTKAEDAEDARKANAAMWEEVVQKNSKLNQQLKVQTDSRDRWRRFYLTLKDVLENSFRCEVVSTADDVAVAMPGYLKPYDQSPAAPVAAVNPALTAAAEAVLKSEGPPPQQAIAGEPNPDYVPPAQHTAASLREVLDSMNFNSPPGYNPQQMVERELYTLRANYNQLLQRFNSVEHRYHSLLEEQHIRQSAVKNPSQVSPSDLPSPGVRP